MGSLLDNKQKKNLLPSKPMKDELPISQSPNKESRLIGLRRRIISSFSVKIQPLSSSAAAAAGSSWASLRRSNSSPEFAEKLAGGGGSFRSWWEWSLSWLLSKKPELARDLEMNEEEKVALGCRSKGRFRYLFCRIRSEIRKVVQSKRLPTTQCGFRYDSFSYAQNFDEGNVKG